MFSAAINILFMHFVKKIHTSCGYTLVMGLESDKSCIYSPLGDIVKQFPKFFFTNLSPQQWTKIPVIIYPSSLTLFFVDFILK